MVLFTRFYKIVKEILLFAEIRGGHAENHSKRDLNVSASQRDLNVSASQRAHNTCATSNLDKFQRLLQVYQRRISGNYHSVRQTKKFSAPDSKSLPLTWN
jgi:hypothetical protein